VNLTFANPIFLAAGLVLLAILIVLGVRQAHKRKAALLAFNLRAESSLSKPLRVFKLGLLGLGLFAACVALARPQRGFHDEEVQKKGIDLLFAVDVSKSMLAQDLKPDRLTRAKLAIEDLLPAAAGDRVGLIAFAGDAFLQVPLTLDEQVFTQTLTALDTAIIPRGGTDVGRAIDVAREALKSEPRNEKILVLLTDGEDLEAHALDEAHAAAKDGVRIYTVGVGTTQGELVPLPQGGFARAESGAFVRSQLDEAALQQIAAATGGAYRQLGADGKGLGTLYADALGKLPKESRGSRMQRVPLERFQWPLGLAVLCFALEPLLGERRRKSSRAGSRALAVAAAIGLALFATGARASVRDAEKEYRSGDFAKATAEYKQAAERAPEDGRLQYNLGAAAYKKGDYAQADAAFEKALRGGQLELQEQSYYDLGNARFRLGEPTAKTAPDETIANWKKAISSYEAALKLDAKDADATFNRDLVKRKLAELEKQQEQKEQDQKKQDQKKQDQQLSQNQKPDQKDGQKKDQPKGGQGQPPNDQQGEQAKDQPGQQPKDQPGQPKDQPGQQAKDQQGQQAKDQQGQQAKDQPGQPPGEQAQQGQRDPRDDVAAPGKMSRNDAKALLDSLKGEERAMTFGGDQRANADDQPVGKDW
jgi:Ca-activated chloride channel family protein